MLFWSSRSATFKRGREWSESRCQPNEFRLKKKIQRFFSETYPVRQLITCTITKEKWVCVFVNRERGHRCSAKVCAYQVNKSVRDTETRRDGRWLLTSLQPWALLSHRCGLYTNGHKVRRRFASSVSPLSSVRSPSRPPPSGWDPTPNWPALTESPVAVSSQSSWWVTQEAAAQAAPPTAAVWSEKGELEPGTGRTNVCFPFHPPPPSSDITHLFEERMSCEGGGRWSKGKKDKKALNNHNRADAVVTQGLLG